MKCPSCSAHHKYADGMICKCGYEFALDPKNDGISDRRFVSFILAAGCNDTYYFTENQLYTAACRKQLTPHIAIPILLAVMATGFLIAGTIEPILLACLLVPLLGTLAWLYVLLFKKLPRDEFDGWLRKYTETKGPIAKLICQNKLGTPPDQPAESDIFDYGVEKVLLVQRKSLVDLLVFNNIHMATRALIATPDGYPDYIAARAQNLLEESPELPVFYLHDATDEGIAWAKNIKARFEESGRPMIEVGIAPAAIKQIKKLNTLRLKSENYNALIDYLPMAMLANGISLSLEKNMTMEEMLIAETSIDSMASFG